MAFAVAANLAPFAKLDSSYNLFDSKKKQDLIQSKQDQSFVTRGQSHELPHGKVGVNNEADIDSGACTKLKAQYAALQFSTYPNLNKIVFALSNNTLYKMWEGWTEFTQ